MKEQVKEWIVDKNLTTDSFDSIMIGVIYNSYHNTLDDPDVREWIGMHPSEFREMLPPNLDENQKLLLEDLKNIKESHEDKNMLGLIWVLGQRLVNKSDIKAFTNHEILDVMRALEQEEE